MAAVCGMNAITELSESDTERSPQARLQLSENMAHVLHSPFFFQGVGEEDEDSEAIQTYSEGQENHGFHHC